MRKLFSLLMVLFFGLGVVWATDKTVKSTFTSKTMPSDGTVTDLEGVVTWSVATEVGVGTPEISGGTASGTSCLKFGSSGSNYFKKIELSTDYYKKHNVKSVVLYIRNNGKKTGTFTAVQGNDTIGFESKEFGAEWTTLTAEKTKGEGGALKVIYEVQQASYLSYIEVLYEEGDAVECQNPVTVTKGEEVNGKFKLSATEICGDGEGEDVLVTGITPDEGYVFDEITTSASGTVDNDNKKVTGITEATTISVVFRELPKYTVSFSTGAGNPEQESITESIGGAGIELPDGKTPSCSDWTFAGWAETAVDAETTEKLALLYPSDKYKPAANVTLYAVYKRIETGAEEEQNMTETFENQTAGATYNSTQEYDANKSVVELAWTMYYGTVSTNDKVSGNQSAQMRWYASAKDALGYIETKTPVKGLKSLAFKARVSNTDVKMSVSYSTDGENWVAAEENLEFSESGKGLDFSVDINGTVGTDYYVRIGVGDGGTAPGSSNYKLIIDDIVFNYKAESVTTYYLSAPSCGAALPKMQIAGAWNVENEAWVLNDMTLAQDKLTATYKVQLAAGNYNFKMLKDGGWLSIATSDGSPYTFHREWTGAAGITDNANNDLKIEADEDGEYLFTWIFANDSLNIAFPAKREPLADGYYLIGQNGWDIKALNNDLLFVLHKEEGDWKEYKLTANLELGQEVKVARVENDEIKEYFPDGQGNHFTIDETFAGQRDIYFSAVINNSVDWARFGGYFWMGANTVQIDVTLPEGISWDDVYAYVWKMVEEKSVNWLAWPGLAALEAVGSSSAPARIAMQKAEGNKYFFNCPVGYNYVVFNNNNDQQSVDLNWSEAKKSFVLSAEKDGEGHYKEKDSATALGNIDVTIEAVKALENGQLIIIKNGVKYNVQGAVVR